MDKLKRFIDDNREAFDADEMLPAGHSERFEQKLSENKSKKVYRLIAYSLAIAASAALWFIARMPTTVSPQPSEQEITAHTCEMKVEIEELRIYYTMQIGDITEEMKQLYETHPSAGAAGLWQACQQILADNIRFETEILPTMPCSDEALFAMTQLYRNSLNGLDNMRNRMKGLSQPPTSDNP